MFYPNGECCIIGEDNPKNIASNINNSENNNNMYSQQEMIKKIQETDFSIIDLNLFLDTHPDCGEALELFTKLCATSKSLKNDYQKKYGPLYVCNSSDTLPFEWVDMCNKWPWEL